MSSGRPHRSGCDGARIRLASERAGDVLVVGLAGALPTVDESLALLELAPAGVILFARNVEDEEQVRRLTSRVRHLIDLPLVLVDQEGGRVDRLRRLQGRSPSLRELARQGGPAVRAAAEATAATLRGLGINVNCAPVLDLDEGIEANGIGDRSPGGEPGFVAEMGLEILKAHAREGVATTLKHFPGLGRTGEDTHFTRPTVTASREELLDRDLVPFRLLLDHAPAVMVSHAAFPALGEPGRPASCSRAVVHDLLRRELGFAGTCVTDDLEMGAVTDWSPAQRAVEALEAGQDLLLFCSDLAQAREARDGIREALEDGRLTPGRVLEAARRVDEMRRGLA